MFDDFARPPSTCGAFWNRARISSDFSNLGQTGCPVPTTFHQFRAIFLGIPHFDAL